MNPPLPQVVAHQQVPSAQMIQTQNPTILIHLNVTKAFLTRKAVRRNLSQKTLKQGKNRENLATAFADDITIIIDKLSNIKKLAFLFDTFGISTCLRLNITKSKILPTIPLSPAEI